MQKSNNLTGAFQCADFTTNCKLHYHDPCNVCVCVQTANLAEADASEEDKIRAMIHQSNHDYNPMKWVEPLILQPTYLLYTTGCQCLFSCLAGESHDQKYTFMKPNHDYNPMKLVWPPIRAGQI